MRWRWDWYGPDCHVGSQVAGSSVPGGMVAWHRVKLTAYAWLGERERKRVFVLPTNAKRCRMCGALRERSENETQKVWDRARAWVEREITKMRSEAAKRKKTKEKGQRR